jgi:hypothetical protein
MIYAAQFDTMNGLLGYLTDQCCGEQPCTPTKCAPPRRGSAAKTEKRKREIA